MFGAKRRERCHQLLGHTCQFNEPILQCRVAAVDRFHSTPRYKNRLLSYCENLLNCLSFILSHRPKSTRRNILCDNTKKNQSWSDIFLSDSENLTRLQPLLQYLTYLHWQLHMFTALISRTWAPLVLRRSLQHSEQLASRVAGVRGPFGLLPTVSLSVLHRYLILVSAHHLVCFGCRRVCVCVCA